MTWHIPPVLPDEDEAPMDATRLQAEVAASAAARLTGQPVVWSDGRVTLTITGMSRVNVTLPQPCTILVTTPDGAQTRIAGMDVASWGDLWEQVDDTASAWDLNVGFGLGNLRMAQNGVTQAKAALTNARGRRNELIRRLAADGVTPYRIAQVTGLSQPGVAKIIGT